MVAFDCPYVINIVNKSLMDLHARTIVNPLNEYLVLSLDERHVSGLINKYAGPSLQKELDDHKAEYGELKFGEVIFTSAYDLGKHTGATTIIHTATKNPGENGKYIKDALDDIFSATGLGLTTYPLTLPLLGCGTGRFDPVKFVELVKESLKKCYPTMLDYTLVINIPVPDKDVYERLKREVAAL